MYVLLFFLGADNPEAAKHPSFSFSCLMVWGFVLGRSVERPQRGRRGGVNVTSHLSTDSKSFVTQSSS